MQKIGGEDYVVATVTGQSFVLNQIRRMIGLAVWVAREWLPLEAVDAALAPIEMPVPRIPGLCVGAFICAFVHFCVGWLLSWLRGWLWLADWVRAFETKCRPLISPEPDNTGSNQP